MPCRWRAASSGVRFDAKNRGARLGGSIPAFNIVRGEISKSDDPRRAGFFHLVSPVR